MNTQNIQDSFDRHRATPEVSLNEYVRCRKIKLGEWVMARRRIYLDKCFWICLCDTRIGRINDPVAHKLLDELVRGVHQNRFICPISDVLFLELLKQTDPQTRLATAELIDELSCGVTLIPHQERVATEIAHFLYAQSGYTVHDLELLS